MQKETMIGFIQTHIVLFYFAGLALCTIFVREQPPLHVELEEFFMKSKYAETDSQCALSCELTQGCLSFLFQEKDCFANSSTTYQGTRSISLSGSTCEVWSLHSADSYVEDEAFPENSVAKAQNYCRDPYKIGYLWCFTPTDWEPCDIPKCKEDYVNDACLQTPMTDYVGKFGFTNDGSVCQRWDANWPHASIYPSDAQFPDGSVSAAENYCRDPGNDQYLWCYTTDPLYRYKGCDVRDCRDIIPLDRCYQTSPTDFTGWWSTTITGIPCQRWDSQSPHKHAFTDAGQFPDATLSDAANSCRDPGGRKGFLWCYTTNSTVKWQPCGIPKCIYHIPCRSQANPKKYSGAWATTYTGKTCQRWDTQSPHLHAYIFPAYFDSEIAIDATHNFCRDPDTSGRLWCYTMDQAVSREPCDIAMCREGHDTDNCQLFSTKAPSANPPDIRAGYRYYIASK